MQPDTAVGRGTWRLYRAYAQCRSNKGAPGIDGQDFADVEAYGLERWLGELALALKQETYRPDPIRRVFIPKANGKLRPLGIPTMKDRAMQALHLLALLPVSETTADRNSYGFRPERSTHDAIVQLFIALARKGSAQWVLEADIKGCFDLSIRNHKSN